LVQNMRINVIAMSHGIKQFKQAENYEVNPVSNYVHMIPPFITEIDVTIMTTIP
jgi:hypothetical protein